MTSTRANRDKDSLPPSSQLAARGGKLIRWENGKPVPVYAPPLAKEQVSDLLTASLSLEYEGEKAENGDAINFDPRFAGMTNIEVIAIRLAERAASGDMKATTELLDRILGKPKQSHETVGVKMSYQDFLEFCEKNPEAQESAEFEYGAAIDIPSTILDEDDDEDLSDIFGD